MGYPLTVEYEAKL